MSGTEKSYPIPLTPPRDASEPQTTISARVVRVVSVSMSAAEMESLLSIHARAIEWHSLTQNERAILEELAAAISEIR